MKRYVAVLGVVCLLTAGVAFADEKEVLDLLAQENAQQVAEQDPKPVPCQDQECKWVTDRYRCVNKEGFWCVPSVPTAQSCQEGRCVQVTGNLIPGR